MASRKNDPRRFRGRSPLLSMLTSGIGSGGASADDLIASGDVAVGEEGDVIPQRDTEGNVTGYEGKKSFFRGGRNKRTATALTNQLRLDEVDTQRELSKENKLAKQKTGREEESTNKENAKVGAAARILYRQGKIQIPPEFTGQVLGMDDAALGRFLKDQEQLITSRATTAKQLSGAIEEESRQPGIPSQVRAKQQRETSADTLAATEAGQKQRFLTQNEGYVPGTLLQDLRRQTLANQMAERQLPSAGLINTGGGRIFRPEDSSIIDVGGVDYDQREIRSMIPDEQGNYPVTGYEQVRVNRPASIEKLYSPEEALRIAEEENETPQQRAQRMMQEEVLGRRRRNTTAQRVY